MCKTARLANKVPMLESEIKSLKVVRKKEDTDIHKIIRLGKQIDQKNKEIENLQK